MCCNNAEDIEVHFTFSKEQFHALNQELMAWNKFLSITEVTIFLENEDLEIGNMNGSHIKYNNFRMPTV